ncbi:MAG: vanadium-dependent haloperoxidase [Candidatus Entotheonellia bacterium]
MGLAIRIIVIVSLLVGLTGPASADVISDWNEKAIAVGFTARQLPPAHTRNVAIVHVAMFDALNSIEPRYTPYRVQLPAAPGASRDAAGAAAAHYLLVRMYPDQAKELDAAFQASLAAVPEGPPKAQGIQRGEHVAAFISDERQTDGANAPNTYRPFTTAGTYVPTVFPAGSIWGAVKPFALKTGGQFRPAAPYALTSAQWAKDYNEIKRLGAKTGSERSAEQTEIARFWEFTGPGLYNPVARQLSAAKNLEVMENARLFALVSMAGADALIAVMDAKYAYNFWRPVTAIRNGDLDGNDATERDPVWEPFIATPMHPEYPCAHCIVQASVASVLEAFFGDAVPTFTLTSPTAPGVARKFVRLSDYAAEVIEARIYDGVHYRISGEVGSAMGRKTGAYAVENHLKPVR